MTVSGIMTGGAGIGPAGVAIDQNSSVLLDMIQDLIEDAKYEILSGLSSAFMLVSKKIGVDTMTTPLCGGVMPCGG